MCRVLQDQTLWDLIFSSIHHPADLKAEECLNEVLKYANEFLSSASDCPMIFLKSWLLLGKGRVLFVIVGYFCLFWFQSKVP